MSDAYEKNLNELFNDDIDWGDEINDPEKFKSEKHDYEITGVVQKEIAGKSVIAAKVRAVANNSVMDELLAWQKDGKYNWMTLDKIIFAVMKKYEGCPKNRKEALQWIIGKNVALTQYTDQKGYKNWKIEPCLEVLPF